MSEKDKTNQESRSSRLLRRVTGKAALGGNLATTDVDRKKIFEAYKNALPEKAKLTPNKPRSLYLHDQGIATAKLKNGKEARLIGLASMGESLVGVIGTGLPGHAADTVTLSLLPFGNNPDSHKNSSTVLKTVDVGSLREITSEGYIQPWRDHTIGRGNTVDTTLEDRSVSRNHLKSTVTEQGIELTDLGSANGTSVVNIDDLMRMPHPVNDDILALYNTLRDEPWTWSPDSADMQVVPAQ